MGLYLLDTDVISELRRLRPHIAVIAWLFATLDKQLFLSAVALGELQAGVEITRQQDSEQANAIEAWINTVASTHNILPVGGVIFRRWAQVMHRRPPHLIEGALIAATALVHGLTVVTRNVRDFERFEVPTLNPFLRAM